MIKFLNLKTQLEDLFIPLREYDENTEIVGFEFVALLRENKNLVLIRGDYGHKFTRTFSSRKQLRNTGYDEDTCFNSLYFRNEEDRRKFIFTVQRYIVEGYTSELYYTLTRNSEYKKIFEPIDKNNYRLFLKRYDTV